jgi:serine/threonine-protein kinase
MLMTILFFGLMPAMRSMGQANTDDQVTKDVIFGEFKAYDDPRKLFSVELPSNWEIKDHSDKDEINLGINDPSDNAAVSIHVWNQDKPLEGGTAQYLANYLKQTVASLTNYNQGEAKVQKDGSTGIYFKWDESLKNGKTAKMWGDAFLEQRGNVVGMIIFLIPEEQYNQKKDQAYHLINSFHIRP